MVGFEGIKIQWVVLGGQVGGSVIYIKSLNYVLVFYSLSFVSIKQVFKCSYSLILDFIVKFEDKVIKK